MAYTVNFKVSCLSLSLHGNHHDMMAVVFFNYECLKVCNYRNLYKFALSLKFLIHGKLKEFLI